MANKKNKGNGETGNKGSEVTAVPVVDGMTEEEVRKIIQQETKRREYQKAYRMRNKEKVAAAHKRYRDNNPEKVKDWQKKYRENNKDKVREYHNNYRKRVTAQMKAEAVEIKEKAREGRLDELETEELELVNS